MSPILKHKFDEKRPIVISLGGSIMYPDQIDIDFLKKFNAFIRRQVKKGRRFIIITGGGRLSRNFQKAAQAIHSKVSHFDSDWIGIHATRLNAQLLRTIMEDICVHTVIDKRLKLPRLTKPVAFGSGWRPGASTDWVSVLNAIDYGAKVIINAGNVDRVYSADFNKHKSAKPFDHLTWKHYRSLVPGKWTPGLSAPIDPVAARIAQKNNIKAIVINGRDIVNFEKLLDGQPFHGTVIE